MSISISTLLTMLPSHMQSSCANPRAKIHGLKSLCEFGPADSREYLFAGDYDALGDYKDLQSLNLLLYSSEKVPAEQLSAGYNVIVIHDRQEFLEFCETVRRMLADKVRLTAISDDFLKIMQDGGDIQSLLDYGFEVLNNPLMAVDATFNYIASAGTGTLNDEPIWEHAITRGALPDKYVSDLIRQATGTANTTDDSSAQILRESSGGDMTHNQIAARLIHNNIVVGYLKLLDKNRRTDSFDEEILLLLSKFVSIVMTNMESRFAFNSSLVENLFTSIILNRIKTPEEISTRQNTFNIKLCENLQIITIGMNTEPGHPDHIFYQLRQYKNYFSKSVVILVNTRFVVLYDSRDLSELDSLSFLESFAELLRENDCSAGISVPFKRLCDVQTFYEQTLVCLELRHLLRDKRAVIRYRDIAEYHMLLHYSRSFDLDSLLHPAIKKLSEIDAENESDLVNTLFTYIRNQQNISATAKAMYIHYNTLKYRIARITELSGINFEDYREVFLISLSQRILAIKHLLEENTADRP